MIGIRQAIVILTAVALAFCYAPTLRGMFEQWSNDEDMSHGFVVPIVILWIVWRERERWRTIPAEPNWWGLAVLAAGAGMQFIAALGAGLFAGSVAFLVSVAGAVLCLGGFAWLRAWALPFLLGLFMLPKLALVYNQVTLPLQLLASRIAAGILTAVGVGVIREGNILDVAGRQVSVVEACNGIRYLLSLGFMAVVFAYLSDTKPWMRMALLVAAVPIAIFANALRVAAAGWSPSLAAGTPHAIAVRSCLCFAWRRWWLCDDCATRYMPVTNPEWRGALVPVFLAAQILLIHVVASGEHPPAPPALARFPAEFGQWKLLREDTIAADIAKELGADGLLSRTYVEIPTGSVASLLVAWYQTQRGGVRQPHSPKVCLPASGWTPEAIDEITLGTAAGAITVNRYLVVKGAQRAVVFYWYQTPRRAIAGEWAAKLWLVADALRDRRTDTALVRVIAWSADGRDAAATNVATGFARNLYPVLREYLPQ